MTQKALKLALEALEELHNTNSHWWQEVDEQTLKKIEHSITVSKEALAEHAMRETQRLGQEIEQKIGCVNHDCDQCKAQPEQEPVQKPVAVVSSCTGVGDKGVRVKWLGGFPQIGDRLYFHPPQRKPLTKEEMFEAIRPLYSSEMSARIAVDYSEDEYRAIEAAHGIKENT